MGPDLDVVSQYKFSHNEIYYPYDLSPLIEKVPTDDAVRTHMMANAELDPVAVLRRGSERIIAGADRARAAYNLWSYALVSIYN